MTNLAHQTMGDKYDGEERRTEHISDREVAERVLTRINESQQSGEGLSQYEAKVLSTLLKSAMRRDEQLDSDENREMLRKLSEEGGIIDKDAKSPHEVANERLESERRIRSLAEFFEDLMALAGDQAISKDEKSFVFLKLQEVMRFYENTVNKDA